MNIEEEERRARLLKMRAERLPKLKQEYEKRQKALKNFSELQSRNFNSNFKPGGKDYKSTKNAKNTPKKTQARTQSSAPKLPVTTARGEMVQHQRMLSQDVNQQASQHIIGIPTNKSRYNGHGGNQVQRADLKRAKTAEDSVRIIPMGGVGEPGIGKNMTLVEYKNEIIIIDMGTLFASDDYPGVNYMIPDIKYLEENKKNVKAILFTHAHLDHIGACRHLLPKFGPNVPIYATEFTLGMIKKQVSELPDAPDLNYIAVNPSEHKIIKVSEHLSVEFIHVLHSIPGSTAIVVRTPNGVIYFSGDWRHEEHPVEQPTDYARMDEIVKKEGIDLMFNESTNIDSPGTHPTPNSTSATPSAKSWTTTPTVASLSPVSPPRLPASASS